MQDRGQRLAQLKACGEELEVGAIANARAPVDKRAKLPAFGLANLGDRIAQRRYSSFAAPSGDLGSGKSCPQQKSTIESLQFGSTFSLL